MSRQPRRDEAALVAYLDNELDAAATAAVEVWLAEDAEARRLLESLESADRRLRAALDPMVDERPPERLLRRIEAAAAAQRRAPGEPARQGLRQVWRQGWLPWAFATALVLLLAGLPATWFLAAQHGRLDERLAQAGAAERAQRVEASLESALQQALETTVSGQSLPWLVAEEGQGAVQPIRTYKSSGGQWCREYRIEVTVEGEARGERGIACRAAPQDGQPASWERKVLFLDEPPLPAATENPT